CRDSLRSMRRIADGRGRTGRLAVAATVLVVALASDGAAEQLPVKAYTVENGLAHNRVKRIVQDSRGFQIQVWTVVADRAGNLWIGTKYGLVKREPDGTMTHVQIEPSLVDDNVSALLLGRDGRLWVGHRAGLIVFDPQGVR